MAEEPLRNLNAHDFVIGAVQHNCVHELIDHSAQQRIHERRRHPQAEQQPDRQRVEAGSLLLLALWFVAAIAAALFFTAKMRAD